MTDDQDETNLFDDMGITKDDLQFDQDDDEQPRNARNVSDEDAVDEFDLLVGIETENLVMPDDPYEDEAQTVDLAGQPGRSAVEQESKQQSGGFMKKGMYVLFGIVGVMLSALIILVMFGGGNGEDGQSIQADGRLTPQIDGQAGIESTVSSAALADEPVFPELTPLPMPKVEANLAEEVTSTDLRSQDQKVDDSHERLLAAVAAPVQSLFSDERLTSEFAGIRSAITTYEVRTAQIEKEIQSLKAQSGASDQRINEAISRLQAKLEQMENQLLARMSSNSGRQQPSGTIVRSVPKTDLAVAQAKGQAQQLSTRYVAVPVANVRSEPDIQSSRIEQIRRNTQVLWIRDEGNWSEVLLSPEGGQPHVAWIHSKLLSAQPATAVVEKQTPKQVGQWHVRGVTQHRAILYQENGETYPVEIGTEVPGMGQVTMFDPSQQQVRTVKGVLKRKPR